jgi:hypothetical protein
MRIKGWICLHNKNNGLENKPADTYQMFNFNPLILNEFFNP